MKKILFISHDASRTGAPFVLLYLMKWLKKNCNYQIDILLLQDGPLRDDFAAVASNIYVNDNFLYKNKYVYHILKESKLLLSDRKRMLRVGRNINITKYDIVYGNTIISLPWLTTFKEKSDAVFIAAIHELESVIQAFRPVEYVSENLSKLDLVLAGSSAVATLLRRKYDISEALIKVAHAYIPNLLLFDEPINETENLRINSINTFVIGMVGNAQWRKGTDLLVPLGVYLTKKYPEFDFNLVWIGVDSESHFVKNIQLDIERANLTNKVILLNSTEHYLNYIKQFDVFALLSREDPFPLVCLEAGLLSKPIIMFDGAGGTIELLQNGAGIIVPYLDIVALGDELYNLSEDTKMRKVISDRLREEVVSNYTVDVACKKVNELFSELLLKK